MDSDKFLSPLRLISLLPGLSVLMYYAFASLYLDIIEAMMSTQRSLLSSMRMI